MTSLAPLFAVTPSYALLARLHTYLILAYVRLTYVLMGSATCTKTEGSVPEHSFIKEFYTGRGTLNFP